MKILRHLGILALLFFVGATSLAAQQAKPKYGIEEYNDYTAAVNEADPAKRIQALDAFLQKYPDSALNAFVFPAYAVAAQQAQRWTKVVEFADRFLSLNPEEIAALYKQSNFTDQQLNAVYYQQFLLHAYSFLMSSRDDRQPTEAVAEKTAGYARRGLQLHEQLYAQAQRPANVTPEQFEAVKRGEAVTLRSVIAALAFARKDYDAAAREYTLLAQQNRNDAMFAYRLGVSALQARQRQPLLGFWSLARALSLLPENQRKGVRDYLVRSLTAHQGFAEACPGRHVEAQAEALIAKARESFSPPGEWNLPTAEQVTALRSELPVKRIFDELKAGGAQRDLIWVASCGLELPELSGEVIEVSSSPDNLVTLKLAVGEEAADAKVPTVEVKVKEPPEAKNLKATDIIRFSGILADYQSEPFLLRLVEGKVNPEDIPKREAPAPARRRPRPSR